ncbi:uncharacterized protein VICG_00047 [Vittaforma corneae ATCC 50505]|uniref:DNA recombination and repair protein Rad51-like C-terminal domain-containing protein n=1 Tax=Vittaforma corneae (strain ATCC 50505) TaxID=993615 RepID=L2GQY8_VITCO|nr:uncharacterized protein VICG_00047 [Vittaforma corneae ATCC 50505]ELA42732.1 hypothetical protein VICG_00047 [Vittaforma corneae ATCC 50505]
MLSSDKASSAGNLNFEDNTIIDLVMPPGMQISPIISDIILKYNHIFILDTQGQLYSSFNQYGWNIGNSKRISYTFVFSLNDLYKRIESIRVFNNFVLVLDSITFVCDVSPLSIKSFSNLLWSLVYECSATIITINHYRIDKNKNRFELIPRMGGFWRRIVSYQVEFTDLQNAKRYRLLENKLNEM